MKKYLPIGSIVLLKGGTKRIMIYGRQQKEMQSDKVWDYIACLYPEGNLSEDYMYLFNHDQIEKVFFIGFQDEEELEFAKEALALNVK
ncbi:hypothetical protein AM500_05350 [Bacillus sp. FJAT-18017]|uniref:DUF4176 domain-containing protein n=1 Tax=Bacillus sp. FJAT-18017 TaxID=1705566 RepID=UPI0006AF89CB|nr:DUF4176 domain-containing protein [Bacillus sp. FJAT-18017]ALC89275.1 hypothetical protein AM500_05350 [Bacillus sp. FJAT-18017]